MIVLTLTLITLVAGFALRYGRGGLDRLGQLHFRGGWMVGLACLCQLGGTLTPPARLALMAVSTLLLAGFCWQNRRVAGVVIAGFGILLNMTVMLGNGGVMPVHPGQLEHSHGLVVASGTVLAMAKSAALPDEQAAFAWLGDRLVLPGPLAHLAVWSIGDVFLLAGIAYLLYRTMRSDQCSVSTARTAAVPTATRTTNSTA